MVKEVYVYLNTLKKTSGKEEFLFSKTNCQAKSNGRASQQEGVLFLSRGQSCHHLWMSKTKKGIKVSSYQVEQKELGAGVWVCESSHIFYLLLFLEASEPNSGRDLQSWQNPQFFYNSFCPNLGNDLHKAPGLMTFIPAVAEFTIKQMQSTT